MQSPTHIGRCCHFGFSHQDVGLGDLFIDACLTGKSVKIRINQPLSHNNTTHYNVDSTFVLTHWTAKLHHKRFCKKNNNNVYCEQGIIKRRGGPKISPPPEKYPPNLPEYK